MKKNYFLKYLLIIIIGITSSTLFGQTYTFTNAGATLSTGPTQGQVDVEYVSTTLDGKVTINTQGIQEWTVPKSGTYRLTTYGAQGGDGDGGAVGGKGALMTGEFNLKVGDVLKILVGQEGFYDGTIKGGGGGGTYITDNTNNPLIIAGGGGGAAPCNSGPGLPGVTGSAGIIGGTGLPTDGGGGINGGGGGGAVQGSGGGGAGLLGNGGTGQAGNYCGIGGAGGDATDGGNGTCGAGGLLAYGGKSFVNGGEGGLSSATSGDRGIGGFGGGGASVKWNCGGGGGGGYSGGGGGSYNSNHYPGGGGGSYNLGTNQVNTAGVKEGMGRVAIEFIALNGSIIELKKEVNNTTPNVGDPVEFTVTVTNNGPENATGIDVLDQLPSGYTWYSDTSGGTYDKDSGLWLVGAIAYTGNPLVDFKTIVIVAKVNATGNYTNIAEVTSVDQADPYGIVHGNQTPGEIDQDQVTVTVDYLPVATDDINSVVGFGLPVEILVTSNDTTGDAVIDGTVRLVNPGAADNISYGGPTIDPSDIVSFHIPYQGTWTVNVFTGSVTFTPDNTGAGDPTTFTADPTPIYYNVEDLEANRSNDALITVDYAPIATSDSSLANDAGPVTVLVLANDTDGDVVNPATVSLVIPTSGTLNVVFNNGNVTSFDVIDEGNWSVNVVTGAEPLPQ